MVLKRPQCQHTALNACLFGVTKLDLKALEATNVCARVYELESIRRQFKVKQIQHKAQSIKSGRRRTEVIKRIEAWYIHQRYCRRLLGAV